MSRAKGDVSTCQMLLGYGCAWNWVSHYNDDATISYKNENRNSLRASSPREVTREWQAKRDAGARYGEIKWELFVCSTPTASPLTRVFALHRKWRGCSQSITFLCNRTRSVFGELVYIRNSNEKYLSTSPFSPTSTNTEQWRRNPPGNWVILLFSGQTSCTRIF